MKPAGAGTPNDGFDLGAYRDAVEAKDVGRWAAFFRDEAEWLEYRHADPPARPNRMVGRGEITAFLKQVAAWPIGLTIETIFRSGNDVAYRMWVDRPDGRRIIEHTMLELDGGRIRRQIDVEAWDPD
jgi:SnoaL-like domain